VQLELKERGGGSAVTEEDKRKTIKLEFGLPQRLLTLRDRSKTVELTWTKPATPDGSDVRNYKY
jgi:hypothetical protein